MQTETQMKSQGHIWQIPTELLGNGLLAKGWKEEKGQDLKWIIKFQGFIFLDAG